MDKTTKLKIGKWATTATFLAATVISHTQGAPPSAVVAGALMTAFVFYGIGRMETIAK